MKEPTPLTEPGRDLASTPARPEALDAEWGSRGARGQGLLAVRAAIERGRVLIAEAKPDEAVTLLDEAMSQISADRRGGSDAHRQILAAVAPAVKGLALEAAGRLDDARLAYAAARVGFEGLGSSVTLSSRDLSDYGVALDALGADATGILRRAVAGGEPTQEACRRLAAVLRREGDLEGARAMVSEALELVPGDIPSLVELGEVLQAMGHVKDSAEAFRFAAWSLAILPKRVEEALTLFDRAIALDPENDMAHGGRGELLRVTGRREEALEAFDRALRINPGNAWVLATKGAALLDSAEYAAALTLLDQALDLDPEYPWALSIRAAAQIRLGQVDSAQEDLERAARLDNAAASWLRLGDLRRQSGDWRRALEAYEKASEAEPENVDALIARAQVLLAGNEARGGLELAQSAERLDRTHPIPPALVGEAFRLLGLFEEALDALNRSLSLAPDASWTIGTRGQVLLQMGKSREAEEDLRRATELAPDLSWAFTALGDALYQLDRNEDALIALDAALGQQPGDPGALRIKGATLIDLGRPEAALAAVAGPLEANPEDGYALDVKARALLAMGQLVEAEDAYRRAAAADTTDSTALIDLASLLHKSGRATEALQAIEDAVAREPTRAAAVASRGRLFAEAGRNLQAVEDLQRATSLDGCPGWVWTKLSEVLYALGRYGEAMAAADRALEARPDDLEALAWKAGALFMLDRDDEALDDVEAVVQRDPTHRFGLRLRGSIYAWRGRHEDALGSYRAALDLDGGDADALLGMGKALAQLSRLGEAIDAFDRALERDPGNIDALAAKGDSLRVLGRFEEAEEHLERVLASRPDDALALRSIGYALTGLRRFEEAVPFFERCLDGSPGSGSALADLALALGRVEQYDRALELANQAVGTGDDAWALAACGALLNDVGDYQNAAEMLRRALESDDTDPWVWVNRGWALAHVDGKTEEAKAAFDAALAIDEVNLSALAGRADMRREMGDEAGADADYEAVIRKIEELQTSDADQLATAGWCHYGLAHFDTAVDVFLKVLTLSSALTSAQFDLGMVMLCRKQGKPAIREYQHGISQVSSRHPLRRRGLLTVAKRDLETAVRQHGLAVDHQAEVDEILSMLQAADAEAAMHS